TVADGSVIDLGNRALVVKRFKHLDVGGGTMTINARTVDVQPGGGIRAVGAGAGGGGVINITTTGALHVEVDGGTPGRIQATGDPGGEIHVVAGGDVTIDGAVDASAATIDGDGGTLGFTVAGAVALNGIVTTAGGALAGGGPMTFLAQGPITV